MISQSKKKKKKKKKKKRQKIKSNQRAKYTLKAIFKICFSRKNTHTLLTVSYWYVYAPAHCLKLNTIGLVLSEIKWLCSILHQNKPAYRNTEMPRLVHTKNQHTEILRCQISHMTGAHKAPTHRNNKTIIHKFSIALFPAERTQRACSHTCT